MELDAHITGVHHVGIVVRDIEAKSLFYVDRLGYVPESEVIHEAAQKVYVELLN